MEYSARVCAQSNVGLDYLLYCGRMTPSKGIDIASRVAEVSGLPLKMIGPQYPGNSLTLQKHCEYLGIVSIEEKAALMGSARAVLCPTRYNEPYGVVQAEAMSCGTPVIATNWGSFPEVIAQGVTGFTCSSMAQFVDAVQRASRLNSTAIRKYALDHFSLEAVAPQYQAYFEHLHTRWDKPESADCP